MAEIKHIYTSQKTMTASDMVAAITTGALDRAVGARALKSLIDRLEAELLTLITFSADLQHKAEAEKAELLEVSRRLVTLYDALDTDGSIALEDGLTIVDGQNTILKTINEDIRAALAEPESGETNQKGDPK